MTRILQDLTLRARPVYLPPDHPNYGKFWMKHPFGIVGDEPGPSDWYFTYLRNPLANLIPSNGTRSLGNNSGYNTTRDTGSKILFINPTEGNNSTGEVYWWDGTNIIDSAGRTANPENNEVYGTNPLDPNEAAIKPFANVANNSAMRTHANSESGDRWAYACGGYADFYLFRRDRTHNSFSIQLAGGYSNDKCMVVASYGPPTDKRAILEGENAPFMNIYRTNSRYPDGRGWMHFAMYSIELKARVYWAGGLQEAFSANGLDQPTFMYWEDVNQWGTFDNALTYLPMLTVINRCAVHHAWNDIPGKHVQGYYAEGFYCGTKFRETIFYKNGFKSNPMTEAYPYRDIFSRNIYQGGGSQLGHEYRGCISANGGSGGPQMRLGAVCRGNLIIEGYTNCSTHSNVYINPWLPGATGKTIDWQGNVHFCYRTPNPKEPSTTGIDGAAHPGWGDEIRDGSFGVTYRHNIVSGEMSIADLDVTQSLLRDGVQFVHTNTQYQDGNRYRQHDNIAEHNIFFRTAIGIGVTGDATGAANNIIRNNKIVANSGVTLTASNLNSSSQLVFQDNSFYINSALPSSAVIGSGNTVASQASYTTEGWVAPNRTLRKYVTEELGLTLLTWEDDPWLSPDEVALYKDSLEYDPTGMKTFMFIATAMRYGGQTPIPTSGKPTPLSDYPWDERFTAKAVVNYVRAGFNRPPINDDFILGDGNLEDYI